MVVNRRQWRWECAGSPPVCLWGSWDTLGTSLHFMRVFEYLKHFPSLYSESSAEKYNAEPSIISIRTAYKTPMMAPNIQPAITSINRTHFKCILEMPFNIMYKNKKMIMVKCPTFDCINRGYIK